MRTRSVLLVGVGLLAAVALPGCGEQDDDGRDVVEMPAFAAEELAIGQRVWMGTCRACHLLGVGGAPAVTDFAQWETRLAKGEEALYRSVLNGIRGDDGKFRMPPRGGNDSLTDEQVRRALDYKLASIEALRQAAD